MMLTDLLFLVSVLFVLGMCIGIAVSAVRGRWGSTGRLGRILAGFVAAYALTLVCVSLARPRRIYAPGERRCFDDWCVAAVDAAMADGPDAAACRGDQGGRTWIADIEVSSDAKRVRQRALDARAELEDRQGQRYQPCAGPLRRGDEPARVLSDELGPGESFHVFLPFRMPEDRSPAGLVAHHGDFPGVIGIGTDQSFLHRLALQPFAQAR